MSTPNILLWDQAYNRNRDGKLPRAAVNVIRTYMDNDTLTGWVKQKTIAEATGLDVSNVRRQIKANVAAGWLVVTERGNSSGLASSYRLAYPPKAGADARIGDSDKAGIHARIETADKAGADARIGEGRRAQTPGKGVQIRPVKAGADARPTTPVTSPRNFSTKRSSIDTNPFEGSDSYGSEPFGIEPAIGEGNPSGVAVVAEPTSGSALEGEPAIENNPIRGWLENGPEPDHSHSRFSDHTPFWSRQI